MLMNWNSIESDRLSLVTNYDPVLIEVSNDNSILVLFNMIA